MRPVVAHIRFLGYISVIYLDDCWEIHTPNAQIILKKLVSYYKDWGSSETQKIRIFLSFMFDSERMTIALPAEKRTKIRDQIEKLSNTKRCKIRDLAAFIDILGFCYQTFKYGWVNVKDFKRQKHWKRTAPIIKNLWQFQWVSTMISIGGKPTYIQLICLTLVNSYYTVKIRARSGGRAWT